MKPNPYSAPDSTPPDERKTPSRIPLLLTTAFVLYPLAVTLGWYLTDYHRILLKGSPIARTLSDGVYLPVIVFSLLQIACAIAAYKYRSQNEKAFWIALIGFSFAITFGAAVYVGVYFYAINAGTARNLV